MNEIEVRVEQRPGEIKSNLDDLAAALRNQMQAYEELEVTEDNIPERKNDLATLRKMSKAIDDRRKDVKREWDKPLKEFEAKVKDVTDIIGAQITRIDGSIKAFDQKRIEEKQVHLRELYDEAIGEYAEFLPYEKIKSDKWNNKTCSDNEIIFSINEQVMKVKTDLMAIKALNSEFEEKLISAYKSSGNNLAVAIQKNTDYQDAKIATEKALREAEERKAREEAERAAKEAAELTESSKMAVVDTSTGEVVGEIDFPMNPPVMVIRVEGEENIDALKDFLELSGIEYEEVQG